MRRQSQRMGAPSARSCQSAALLRGGPPHNHAVQYDLDRFVGEQARVYDGVLDELRRGRKTGHWIWFIFPQIAGLGHSAMSQRFAIASLDEARAYLAHPVLGGRLRECAETLLGIEGHSAEAIFGSIDARKLRSSMTLFHRAAPDEPVFAAVLDRYFEGVPDELTDHRLG
jgi:uncharacterized protein (DUF1810 family)